MLGISFSFSFLKSSELLQVQDQHVAVQAMQVAAKTLKVEQTKINLNQVISIQFNPFIFSLFHFAQLLFFQVEDLYDDMEELMEEMNEVNEVRLKHIFF